MTLSHILWPLSWHVTNIFYWRYRHDPLYIETFLIDHMSSLYQSSMIIMWDFVSMNLENVDILVGDPPQKKNWKWTKFHDDDTLSYIKVPWRLYYYILYQNILLLTSICTISHVRELIWLLVVLYLVLTNVFRLTVIFCSSN